MKLFREVTKFVRFMLMAANIVVIAAMCACGYAGHVSPEQHPWLEMLVLAFPVPLTLNILFLLIWLLVSPRRMLIPIVGILLCWGPVRAYCPVNKSGSPDGECIKVMSFNVANFSQAKPKEGVWNTVVDYLLNHEADILCLQEVNFSRATLKKLDEFFVQAYPYSCVITRKGKEKISIHSKFPILSHQEIETDTRNISGACVLDVNGDSILLVNTHLETTSLKDEDRKEIGSMIQQRKIDKEKGSIMKKLCQAAVKRAPQVDSVAAFLEKHKETTTILCGDFNDPPNSYPYHRVSQWLDNCYENSGTGLAFTFCENGMNVRIDNIFCSKDLKAVKCEIDKETHVSDHFPITCWIKKRPKS